MTNKKYAFFLDIDNTLYCNGIICNKNREAINYVREKGHFVFINTARSLFNVPKPVKELPVDGFITSIGCSVIINGEKILSAALNPEDIAQELDFMTENGVKFLIEGENLLIGNKYYKNEGEFPTVENGKELLERFGNEIMPKIFTDGILPQNCIEYLRKKHTVFQHPTYAEYAVEGYSKASGMFLAAEKCGVKKENCVAMGDSLNDLTMLEAAGISVAMGNSVEDIKNICDIITCHAKDGGVAEAMHQIVK